MTKIAFTSCIRYEAFKEQPEWDLILDQNPDYLFLLGDNIYMDYGLKFLSKEPIGSPKEYPNPKFKEVMEQKYFNQFNLVPSFKRLVEVMRNKNGFFGIWDDHDFAWNDAKGKEVCEEKREISRSLFHKYMDCSTNMPHVYYHVDLDCARVIFIDNRTDASCRKVPKQLISEEQFLFIEDKLNHSFEYTILCGGITLTKGKENWSKYETQLKRLCQLVKNKKKVIFLGGDIHQNKFIKPKRLRNSELSTPIQLISSGMQVDYLDLRFPFDDLHNWGLLELASNEVSVSFFNKRGLQKRKSEKANKCLKDHFKPFLSS